MATVDYDVLWSSEFWGDTQDFGPVHRHSAQTIVKLVKPLGVTSVIDVGCGTGLNLQHVQGELGLTDVTGVDVSEAAIEAAKRRVQGDLRVMDVMNNTPIDRQFDLVFSAQVIEHIDEDQRFLEILYSLCGRYCLVATMQGRMRPSEVHIGHLRNYSRAGLTGMIERAGFKVEKVVEWGFPFYSPLFRNLMEMMGGHKRQAGQGRFDRLIASVLYQLYRLNSSSKGDVIFVLASKR